MTWSVAVSIAVMIAVRRRLCTGIGSARGLSLAEDPGKLFRRRKTFDSESSRIDFHWRQEVADDLSDDLPRRLPYESAVGADENNLIGLWQQRGDAFRPAAVAVVFAGIFVSGR